MATRTTTQTGPVSAAATFGGNTFVDGDIIVVANGHILTIDVSIIAGANTGTPGHAIAINGASSSSYGTLRVSSGVTLTLRGVDKVNNTMMLINRYARFEPQPGSIIVGDPVGDNTSIIRNLGILSAIGSSGSKITFTVPAASLNWNNTVTAEVQNGTKTGKFDDNRHAVSLSNSWISNSAGTALGSFGDSSVSFSNLTPGTILQTAVATLEEVISTGQYWVDYDIGLVIFWYSGSPVVSVTYKHLSLTKPWSIQSIQNTTYNEAIFRHCVIEYMGQIAGADAPAIDVQNKFSAASAADRLFELSDSTIRYCYRPVGLKNVNGTLADPILIARNNFYEVRGDGTYGRSVIRCYQANNTFVSLIDNVLNLRHALLYATPPFSAMGNSPGWLVQRNTGVCQNLLSSFSVSITNGGTTRPNVYPDLLVSDNIFRGNGRTDDARIIHAFHGLVGQPVVITRNVTRSHNRAYHYASYNIISYNVIARSPHHVVTTCGDFDAHITGVEIHHNIHTGSLINDGASFEVGYPFGAHLDGVAIYNNTSINNNGLASMGDAQDNLNGVLVTGARYYDNLHIGATTGFIRASNTSARTIRGGIARNDHNNYWNPSTRYNNYNRGASFLQAGEHYGIKTKNVAGVSLYDPSYATAQAARSLVLTHTSALDRTLAWGGGAAVQLVYGHAGTPVEYTSTSAASPGTWHGYGTIDVSSAPWSIVYGNAANPRFMWILITSGAGVGQVRAITTVTTSKLYVAPNWTVVPTAGDTFVIIKPEVQLFDSGATDYVRAGIDARTLPASSQTDTGISIELTDLNVDPSLLTSAYTTEMTVVQYAPQNTALNGTASNGGDIGAVSVYIPPVITTTTLPDASEDEAYSQTLLATGESTPLLWDVSSGSLPTGLVLSSAGALTGTPSVAGDYTFTVRVTDALAHVDTQALSVEVVSLSVGSVGCGNRTSVGIWVGI